MAFALTKGQGLLLRLEFPCFSRDTWRSIDLYLLFIIVPPCEGAQRSIAAVVNVYPLKATADEASKRVVSNTEAIKKRDSGPRSRLLDQRSFQASSQTICVPTICSQLICAYASSANGFELGRANPRPSSQATLRGFVAVFRPARGFFRNATTVFFVLGTALTEDGKSSLGCFVLRWWPWFRGWMRADSSSICS